MSDPIQTNDGFHALGDLRNDYAARSKGGLRCTHYIRQTISLIVVGGLVTLALVGQFARVLPVLDPANALAPIVFVLSLTMFILGLRYRRIASILAALSLLFSGERVLSAWVEEPTTAVGPEGRGTTILTLNAWRHQDRPKDTARAIAASGADIVLLQEAGPVLQMQDEALAVAYPYRSDCPENCDLAILSKIPVRDFRYRLEGSNGNPVGPRIVFADLVLGTDRPAMTVASMHIDRLSQGGSSRSALAVRLEEMFASLSKNDLVIGGDFNMTPYSFVYQEAAQVLRPIRRVSAGDASFPARLGEYRALPVFAIDHIFAAPRWQAVTVNLGSGFNSDHLPVAVRLHERVSSRPL